MDFDFKAEQINDMVNLHALLHVLSAKGVITTDEFTRAKDKATAEIKRDYPKMFK